MGIKGKSRKQKLGKRVRNRRTIKIKRQPEDYENIKYNGILEIPKLSQKTEEFILNQYVLDSMNRKDNHLSKEELILFCKKNTINCFFYYRQHIFKSGLAAVTDQAIVSGKPLLVTYDNTFRHIHKYIDYYPK